MARYGTTIARTLMTLRSAFLTLSVMLTRF